MNAQKILIGTLSGLVAGIAIGLLTAPAKGSETRQKIADSANSMRKKLRSIAGKTIDELDELKDLVETEMDGLRADVKERVLKLIETSKQRYNHKQEEVVEL